MKFDMNGETLSGGLKLCEVWREFLIKFMAFHLCPSRDLFNEWTVELKNMADRIIKMREELYEALKSRGMYVYLVRRRLVSLDSS